MVIVHLWGLPARVDDLLALARRHNLKVIEDASHALGASSGGVPCGRFGDISVFSMQTSKLAAAGEGGVLLTDDDACYERAVCLGDIVRTYELTTPARRFAATSFGIKTRMAPLSAAIGRTQLARLDAHNARRADGIERLGARLQRLGFDTFPSPPGTTRVYFEHLVRYTPAAFGGLPTDALIAALRAEGCEVTGPRYPLVHEQPLFTEGHWRRIARLQPGDHADWQPPVLPATRALQQHMLRLPAFPWATDELIEQYAVAFEKVQAHAALIPGGGHA
jgi:dTDP-4-amino-4,6-dideoxygalactose transaminase